MIGLDSHFIVFMGDREDTMSIYLSTIHREMDRSLVHYSRFSVLATSVYSLLWLGLLDYSNCNNGLIGEPLIGLETSTHLPATGHRCLLL